MCWVLLFIRPSLLTHPHFPLSSACRLIDHYDQCIKVACEVLLACCAPTLLVNNISLLYALLQDKPVITSLAEDSSFADAVVELADIITHFAAVLSEAARQKAIAHAKTGSGGFGEEQALASSTAPVPAVTWDEGEVSTILLSAARTWTGGDAAARQAETLKRMKFMYHEDANPENFFVPYNWTLALAYMTDIAWNLSNVRLCGPESLKVYL